MRYRNLVVTSMTLAIIGAGVTSNSAAAEAAAPVRIDLRVLVVSDGGASTTAIADELTTAGVPVTTVNLADANRPVLTPGFLADTVNGGPRAKFQAVVLPNDNPFADPAEMAALVAYERQYGIRQVDAYTWPSPAVGLTYGGYAGSLDGLTASLTPTALAGPFRYLRGPVGFDDVRASVDESYGYLATPVPGAGFEPYLTVTAPNGTTGTLAGVYTHDGRSEFVLTFAYNGAQRQFRLLAHGLLTWMTRGVHLGHERNYFSVHVDDVFLADGRWDTARNCTAGEGCGDGTVPTIRMTPADAAYAIAWQQRNAFPLDMYFNAYGSETRIREKGSDPLTTYMVANRYAFRWANHTYSHKFLGCTQDFTVFPWKCATDETGNTAYMSKDEIAEQIDQNVEWARRRSIPIQRGEIVTGEHSGFFVRPQQPHDNPNLGPAFTETGIAWAGTDHSRDPNQRQVGSALTVPRHPISVFFNVAKASEEVDEYNWIYTSRADGGSGVCEDNPATVTCVAPLGADGFSTEIVPAETRIALSHILANDPMPHYVHQANLSEERLLYPLLDSVLGAYRAAFASNTPLINQRMSANGAELARRAAWRGALADGKVTAYVQAGRVVVAGPAGVEVPLTVPEGTVQTTLTLSGRWITATRSVFGAAYAGERSAYLGLAANQLTTLALPAGAQG